MFSFSAYVQDDNDKQYILDTIPASLRKVLFEITILDKKIDFPDCEFSFLTLFLFQDFSEIEHETR